MAFKVLELDGSTRTAADAAQTIGCTVQQIIKSLIFKGEQSGEPVLVLASGTNRVDEKAVAKLVGEPIGKADADFAKEVTGYAIGGVPPIGHRRALRTFIDEDLLSLGDLWAAAGTPHAVFCVHADAIVELTGGTVAPIKK